MTDDDKHITSISRGEQWWRSGESTRLPPMWLGFDSQTRRHMWVGFFSIVNKISVSKETVVLRRWEIGTEIDFIKRVDKGRITTVKDLES